MEASTGRRSRNRELLKGTRPRRRPDRTVRMLQRVVPRTELKQRTARASERRARARTRMRMKSQSSNPGSFSSTAFGCLPRLPSLAGTRTLLLACAFRVLQMTAQRPHPPIWRRQWCVLRTWSPACARAVMWTRRWTRLRQPMEVQGQACRWPHCARC